MDCHRGIDNHSIDAIEPRIFDDVTGTWGDYSTHSTLISLNRVR